MKYFLLLFFSLSAISCHNTGNKSNTSSKNEECINKILQLDETLGESRNHSCEKISLSNTIDNYAHGLNQLNFDHCPIEFKIAFSQHIEAWIEMKKVTDKYPEKRGEMHDLFAIIESGKDSLEFKLLLAEIWSTWGEIEQFVK